MVYNNLLHLIYLKENGVLGKYESPENRFLMKEAIDPDGYWVGGDIDVLVTGFNTKMISRSEVPTSLRRILDGKLKGQMAINSNNPYALVGMASLRGEEQGIAYMRNSLNRIFARCKGLAIWPTCWRRENTPSR